MGLGQDIQDELNSEFFSSDSEFYDTVVIKQKTITSSDDGYSGSETLSSGSTVAFVPADFINTRYNFDNVPVNTSGYSIIVKSDAVVSEGSIVVLGSDEYEVVEEVDMRVNGVIVAKQLTLDKR